MAGLGDASISCRTDRLCCLQCGERAARSSELCPPLRGRWYPGVTKGDANCCKQLSSTSARHPSWSRPDALAMNPTSMRRGSASFTQLNRIRVAGNGDDGRSRSSIRKIRFADITLDLESEQDQLCLEDSDNDSAAAAVEARWGMGRVS